MAERNPSILLYAPGDARLEERTVPTLSDPHDVLIRINYVGVCGGDVHFWKYGGIGANIVKPGHPLVMGHEAAGTIHSIGSAVSTLRPGDRVALEPGFPCRRCQQCKSGLYNLCPSMTFAASPTENHGTLCKLFRLPEDFCYKLPPHVSLEEGVLLEPCAVAVHMTRQASVGLGDQVVVFGAGTVGLLCGAVAKAFGAAKVVYIDILERKLKAAKEFVEGCGTFVPDGEASAHDNAKRLVADFDLGEGADVVMEASGAEASVRTGIHVLNNGGRYVQGGLGRPDISFPIVMMSEKELVVKGSYRYGAGDFRLALSLVSDGKIRVKELITSKVAFENATEAWEKTRKGEGIKTLIEGFQE